MSFLKITVLLLVITGSMATVAQTKTTYDLASFTVPKGWKKEAGKISVGYLTTDSKTGDYAKIIIYKSIEGSGNLETDFNIEWNDLVATAYKPATAPETEEDKLPNNWKVKSGFAAFTFNNRQSVASLLTASSNGTKMSIVFLTNSDKYQKEIEAFGNSLQFKKAPLTQNKPASPGQPITTKPVPSFSNFTFSSSNFDDGWTSTIHADYVLAEKNNHSVYLNYPVPYNASQFSGTGVRDAAYYWDNYVTRLFTTKTKQFNDGFSMALKPPYMEGEAIDKRTGSSCFIGMYLVIVPNAVSVVIGTAPDETAFRRLFPKANDPFGSDLAAMTRYNKFAVAAKDIIGKWQNGNTETAHWYYVSPSGYEGYAGMTLAATSATFSFNNNGTYSSIHNGATGAVGNMNTFQQEFKGSYTVTNWMITATNRYGGKTDKFNASFMAIRGGRILKLNNGAGQEYNLVKVK